MHIIKNAITSDEINAVQTHLSSTVWVDGKITAGQQSAMAKHNQQLPENSPGAIEAGKIILTALQRNAQFFSAALPKRIMPPLFNRYTNGMQFKPHIDNAIRTFGLPDNTTRLRTDLSATLFLSEANAYDGGELVIEQGDCETAHKLNAGDMLLYPANTIHRVNPITNGARMAAFFWIESMIASSEQRSLLNQLDSAIMETREAQGDSAACVRLVGCYHNLLRMWAQV